MRQKSKIDLIVEVVRPPEREAECRKHVALLLSHLRDVTVDPAPKRTRDHLRQVIVGLKNAKKEIAALPPHFRSDLPTTELDRLIKVADARAKKIVVTRSGGSNKVEAARKLAAAAHAFDLLNDWGRRVPTLSRDGEYYALAAQLYRLATDRNVDLEGPCKTFLKLLEKDDFPNASKRKRMIEDGRKAGEAFETILARWA